MVETTTGLVRRLHDTARDRPALLTALFGIVVACTVVAHLSLPRTTPGLLFGLPWLVPMLVVAVALWSVLPWRPGGARWPSAAFLGVAALIVVADGTGVTRLILLLALANVGLLHRTAVAALATGAVAGGLVLGMILLYGLETLDALVQGLGVVLLSSFVIAIAGATRHARRAHEEADRLAAELAAANRALQEHADRAHELAAAEERARMARDLHDSIGHHLTVIKVDLENAERYRHRDVEVAWVEVRQAKTVTAAALGEVRRWARAMRSPLLDGQRGSAALHALARSFDGTGVTVEVSVEGDERPLDETREVVLFRVLQEAMTNALRHSGASRVRARLAFEPDALALDVVDDGQGCAGAPAGFGLRSLADRVSAVGGVLDSGDAPAGGFAVHLRLPDAA